MALFGPWPFLEGTILATFLEEVCGKHSEYVGYLLERVRPTAALMLQSPNRSWRKPGPLCQLALREPLVDPQLL
jgi:hypothetical protein